MADSTTDNPYHATQQPEPEPETRPVPSPSSLPPSANPKPISNLGAPPPPSVQPSFRAAVPQFSAVNYQMLAPPTYDLAGQPIRYAPPLMPNGYPAIPQPPGIFRYPSPYAPMIRPTYPLRLLVGVMPPLARLPVVGTHGPIIPPVVRPFAIASVASKDKLQTTVYIGKISSTVENDFMLSLLQLCGPVKNWKRPQDPTGTLKGFGFCEFESAEGVLRALRLLSKLSVDGQKLMVNVNQTTREYLELYVEKKMGSSKNIEGSETEVTENMEISTLGANTNESVKSSEESTKPSLDEQKDGSDSSNKVIDAAKFGLVTDEDREADCDAIEKLTGMIGERLKSKPLPPPPPRPKTPVDGLENSEQPSGSRDWESDGDVAKNDSDNKNEDDKTAESKPSNDNDRTEPGSPDRSRRHDRSRDRERDLKRDKEKELERYEREREQERAKRERDRNYKSVEDERRYTVHEKEWETRERERDHWQKREREREKESAHERKWKIMDQERDSDDGYGKKRKFKSSGEDRKRRLREKEEDLADRLREEEQIAEAKMRAEEEQQKKLHDASNVISGQPANGHDKAALLSDTNSEDIVVGPTFDKKQSLEIYEGKGVVHNGVSDESAISSDAASDTQQNGNTPTRKLGFGLSGSGKRAAVPSVFNEDEDEDARKEKKMRPLVPIDYSEEQQAVQPSISERPPATVVAAAIDVNHISTLNTKKEKHDVRKERVRHSHERSSQRDRHRHEEETSSTREESRKNNFGWERANKVKAPEKQKLLDAKQLIDTIPKTKDELFSYEINWVIYDQNALHERMKSWISKKITDFLGEEEVTLVDYIVSSTQEHVDAGEMLERLQTILDDEAELFVLKMWRMLIFEIKKVETGLAPIGR